LPRDFRALDCEHPNGPHGGAAFFLHTFFSAVFTGHSAAARRGAGDHHFCLKNSRLECGPRLQVTENSSFSSAATAPFKAKITDL
jgi:hypothetical protein